MNRRKVFAGIAVAAALVVSASPATAATSAQTTVTFTLVSGTLAIDVAAPSIALGNQTPDGVTSQFSADLVATTVTDNRNSLSGYTVSANCDDFTDGGTNTVTKTNVNLAIPALNVGEVTVGGDVVTDPSTLFVPSVGTACGATGGAIGTQVGGSALTTIISGLTGVTSSNNVVTYTPQITVTIPPDTTPATYSSIVYQTVA